MTLFCGWLHRQGEHPDLIESVRDGEPWQADYSFLELCTDRIVFAVPKSHPLAGLKQIDYAAMQPYTMVTAPENLSPSWTGWQKNCPMPG